MRLFMFVIVLIASSGVAATTFQPVPLNDVVASTDVLARVWISEATSNTFRYNGELRSCGFVYRANVRNVLRGPLNEEEITFVSYRSLSVGREHLVFFSISNQDKAPSQKYLKSWSYVDSDAYKECKKGISKTSLYSIGSYEFSELFREDNYRSWLVVDLKASVIPDELKTMKMNCESEDNASCERTSEPVFVHWNSLKEYLLDIFHSANVESGEPGDS